MTSPESPDMDRLREVVTEAIDAVIDGWMQGDPWLDDERLADAVLAALLPVHREMVLTEAAHMILDHRDRHFPADGNDVQRRARRILQIAVQVVSPTPTRGQLAEKLVEMGVLDRAASTPPGAPGPPQTAERVTPAETGGVERVGRFEELLAAEHEQFDQRGELLRSIERLTADISRDLRASAQDMRAEHRNTDAVLLTEAADKLDGLIALLAQAETERDEWKHRATRLRPAAIHERESLRSDIELLLERLDTAQTAYLIQADELAEARREAQRLAAERDRLAETVRRYEPVIERAQTWRRWVGDRSLVVPSAQYDLAAAVDALGDTPAVAEREKRPGVRPLLTVESDPDWVCRKCEGPLSPCVTCRRPAQCGESWCVDHDPDDGLWDTPSPTATTTAPEVYVCAACRGGGHEGCDWDEQIPPRRCACPCPAPVESEETTDADT